MSLINQLPPVRGKISENVPLAPYTWLRVGGPAEVLFMPKDEADLAHFLSSTPDEIPVTILGVASNTIIRDGGIKGVVVRLVEFYAGIPGTIGGALRMNAGCYGTETKDVLVEAIALDRTGRRQVMPLEELGYSYRHSDAWMTSPPAARKASPFARRQAAQHLKTLTKHSLADEGLGKLSMMRADAAFVLAVRR